MYKKKIIKLFNSGGRGGNLDCSFTAVRTLKMLRFPNVANFSDRKKRTDGQKFNIFNTL